MSSIGKIGLFDSGLGGLTVLRALNKMLPDAAKVYYGDTLHLPYGDKSDEAIVGYSMEVVQFLKDQGCGLIVIACNSASAAAGEILEERFPELTFVNVIDPVVDYPRPFLHKRWACLVPAPRFAAVPTLRNLQPKTVKLELHALATPLLVPLIEDGFLGTGIDASVLAHYLKDPAMNGITSLCSWLYITHY